MRSSKTNNLKDIRRLRNLKKNCTIKVTKAFYKGNCNEVIT